MSPQAVGPVGDWGTLVISSTGSMSITWDISGQPKKSPDERRLHFLVLRERRSSSSLAGEGTTDWISDDMGALMVLKAKKTSSKIICLAGK